MFRHNLLIIFRNMKRNKSSFFINLIGLSTGLACALLIYLWVNDELHVDKFHQNDNRLYQVMMNEPRPYGIETTPATPGLLAQAMGDEFPEIEYSAAVFPSHWFGTGGIISLENVQIQANEKYVSKNYFHIFSYKLLQGDINQALPDKNAVIISDEIAAKLFTAPENAIGKTIEWKRNLSFIDFSGSYTISGVFKKPPANSTDQFDMVFSYDLIFEKLSKNLRKWSNSNPYTFLTLKPGADVEQFNVKIKDFIKTKDANSACTLFIQQYSKRYLYGRYENGLQAGGRIVYVRLFSMIALFILIIACINFMNLSTAKASGRMKEVGVKKTIGANRKALIAQYLSESMIIVLLALIIAILLVELLLPQFNLITGKNLSVNYNSHLIFIIGCITLFTGLASGSYPAFFLSGFNPVVVLKGKLNTSFGEVWARRGLVIFQFIISVILIVSVIAIYKQIAFIQSKNLGFKKDNVIGFKKEGKLEENFDPFLAELKNVPGVVNASNSTGDLTGHHSSTIGGVTAGTDNDFRFANLSINYDFFETLGIELKEGRTFSREFGAENSKIIFNETGIKLLGLENPVGKIVKLWGKDMQTIGVVKDFHFESLYSEIEPCFFRLVDDNFNRGNNIWVKIKAGTEQETIARIKKLYQEFNPGLIFEFRFLDDDFQALYEAENRVAVLSRYFAGIAILISCLGLFGLAAFTAERRTKEIGVRKVLGSSVPQLIALLTGDFTKIVLASMLVSLPVSFFITRHWLDSFAYRIELNVWYFLGAGMLTLLIAWLTVGAQAIRAALVNPVEALRYE
ncbi:ABC transporter permease [candidate division KSB1 bacterium]|nr:ABC transporter permease [candidate division KSB1 bacterium]